MEWVLLGILWTVSLICTYILITNLLLLPSLGPPWTPTPEQTWWQWLFIAFQHPYVWPAALATVIALILTISLTIYFALWIPSRVDRVIQLELHRIGPTTKLRLHRQYVTKIDSKGLLVTKLLAKTTSSGEYGLVVLRASFPKASAEELESVAQRNFLAWDKNSIATVSSVDELHFKITQLARAFAEL
jgi:hypothetical protein